MKRRHSWITLSLFIAAPFGASFAQECLAPPTDLVSWWPCEGDGVDLADGNRGTLGGNASVTLGVVTNALRFDVGHVKVPRAPNLDVGGQITVELWLRGDASNPMNQCCQGILGTDNYLLGITAGGLYFGVITTSGNRDTSAVGGTVALTPAVWYHVAGTYDGSAIKLYVNGVEVRSVPWSGTINPMNPDFSRVTTSARAS